MKTIILTAPLGHGHNSVANSISAYLTKQNIENVTLDLYEYIQPMLKDFMSKKYYFSMKSASLIKDFASDCILTKPGGITTSEASAKGLPMIMIGQLPGVEDRNVEFLLNNGAAIYASKTFPVDEALHLLLDNPKRRQTIEESMRSLAKPNFTNTLCDFLIEKLA